MDWLLFLTFCAQLIIGALALAVAIVLIRIGFLIGRPETIAEHEEAIDRIRRAGLPPNTLPPPRTPKPDAAPPSLHVPMEVDEESFFRP